MKIAFIVGEFPALSETFILNQITGLIDLGNKVEIFALGGNFDRKIHPDVMKYNLKDITHYIDVPPNRIVRIIKAIFLFSTHFSQDPIRLLRSLNLFRFGKQTLSLNLFYFTIKLLHKNFDVLYCHFGTIGNIGACLKNIGIKGKLVTVLYGADIKPAFIEKKNFYTNLFNTGDLFIAITQYHYKIFIHLGIDSKKIILHPVGIDVKQFSQKQPDIVTKNSVINILTVARLVEDKGLEYGIKAIKELRTHNPTLRLNYNIIGEGPLSFSLRKLVKDLNLTETVHFAGPMTKEEIIEEMKKNQIFILPSISETFGVVLLEAQAMHLPVIATNIGGVSEALVDGKSGFLVPSKDIKSMAEKMEYLINNRRVGSKMGRYGRKFVESHYSINVLNKQLNSILNTLITKT